MSKIINIVGQTFGNLKVLKKAPKQGNESYWICECSCGNETIVSKSHLRNGHTKSCGCLNYKPKEDLTNRKFTKLKVLSEEIVPDKPGSFWKCICDCGKKIIVSRSNLVTENTKSCGCYKSKLTKDQINEIIKLYKNGIAPKEIGEKFNIRNNSVTRLLKKNGIERNQAAPKTNKKTEQIIIYRYLNNESSEKIAKDLNINGTTVCRILKRNKIKIRPATQNKRRYVLNDNWLNNVDTEEKAYFLGLMWSDGNISKRDNTIKISLQEPDRNVLDQLSEIFYKTNRVKIYKSNNLNQKDSAILFLHSQKLKNRLRELNCVPNKTFVLRFPSWLDEDLYKHFIRGVIDGDGHVSNIAARLMLTGYIEFLKDIICILNKKFNINPNIRPDKSSHVFEIKKKESLKTLLTWLYADSNIHINRKYEAYKYILSIC